MKKRQNIKLQFKYFLKAWDGIGFTSRTLISKSWVKLLEDFIAILITHLITIFITILLQIRTHAIGCLHGYLYTTYIETRNDNNKRTERRARAQDQK